MDATSAMRASSLFLLTLSTFGAEYRPVSEQSTLSSFVLTVEGPRISISAQKRAGGHFVQQGLPDMGSAFFDEDDVVPLPAIFGAQLSGQFETARAAPDDHDLRFLHGVFCRIGAFAPSSLATPALQTG
jgi:hypothetical protein